METGAKVRDLIHKTNPYNDFCYTFNDKIEGWGSNSLIFDDIIEEVKPKLIVEVGTWKGKLAIHMANCMKSMHISGEVVCIDTFLGESHMWDISSKHYDSLSLKNGFPQFYYEFMTNIVSCEVSDYVTPLPLPFSSACNLLHNNGVVADLIYLDGSHVYEDVLTDLYCCEKISDSKTVIFGHDLPLKDVEKALREYCKIRNKHFSRIDKKQSFWRLMNDV
jgi:hypothetical protein